MLFNFTYCALLYMARILRILHECKCICRGMYTCMHMFMCVYIQIYADVYSYVACFIHGINITPCADSDMDACIYVLMYLRMYVWLYACMHACMHACMRACTLMSVCLYVCMYVCIYVCLYTHSLHCRRNIRYVHCAFSLSLSLPGP